MSRQIAYCIIHPYYNICLVLDPCTEKKGERRSWASSNSSFFSFSLSPHLRGIEDFSVFPLTMHC